MTMGRKGIQLSLILIGIILILSTYFLYPRITEKVATEENRIKVEEKTETDAQTSYFENIEYKGIYNINNPFVISSEEALISEEDPDIVFMTSMKIIIEMRDGRIITITSDKGTYNKKTYDCFFRKNVEATDGKTVLNSENLDLVASRDIAEIYNNVILRSENNSLIADKIEYDFEKKYYKVTMFNNEKVKVKLAR